MRAAKSLRNAVTFCEDCANRLPCNEFLLCYRDELCTLQDCYIPREYPEIKECEDGYKPPEKEIQEQDDENRL